MSLAGIQLGISGENLERPVDIQINRIEPLAVSFDVDHRTVIVQLGRLVGQMQLVKGQRLFQLPGIDQVLRIQFDDVLIVGIADRKRRNQVVELKEVVPVKRTSSVSCRKMRTFSDKGSSSISKSLFDTAR